MSAYRNACRNTYHALSVYRGAIISDKYPFGAYWIHSISALNFKPIRKMVAIGLRTRYPSGNTTPNCRICGDTPVAESAFGHLSLSSYHRPIHALRNASNKTSNGANGFGRRPACQPTDMHRYSFSGASWTVPVQLNASQRRRAAFTYPKIPSRDGWIKKGVNISS